MPTSANRATPSFRLLRATGDTTLGLLALNLAFLLRIRLPVPLTAGLLPSDRLAFFASASLLVLLTQNLILYFFGFYDPPRPLPRLDLLRRLLAAATLQGLVLIAAYFLSGLPFPRSVLVGFVPLNVALLYVFRYLLQHLHRPPVRRVAIVGLVEGARELARNIERFHWHGLTVAGFVPRPGEANRAAPPELGPELGTVDDLPGLLERGAIDIAILTGSHDDWQTRLVDRLAGRQEARGTLLLLPSPFESLIGGTSFRSIHDMALIEVLRDSAWLVQQPLKRGFDILVACGLLVVTLPVLAGCALAVRFSSPGPIFYWQERIGRAQKPFLLLKLRTMATGAEDGVGETMAQPFDPRVTLVGRFLRGARLDELPQLWNVVAGSMSLVGPRPERPGFVLRYLALVPGYAERFMARPGLTGLAQVNGDYRSSAENKLRYDLAYIANWSFWLDLSILFRTVKIVLTSRGT